MRKLLTPIIVLACFGALFLTAYGAALFGGGQFGYRDAGHFYYPLHERVQAEWNAGRWPLWEPEENAGMPLLGNPAAAVLYPGKVVFAILPYPWAARVYIVAHTALAFVAMLVLQRSWQTSWVGSALGSLSYAFGAPVLFQYANVIYLVGAAWMPLGVHAVDRFLRLGRRWGLVELAIVLAMQVLGGDPESAYLLGLSACGYAAFLSWRRARGADRSPREPGDSPLRSGRRWTIALIAVSGLLVWAVGTIVLAIWLPHLRPRGLPPRPLPWMAWVQSGILVVWGLILVGVVFLRKRAGWPSQIGRAWLGLAGAAGLAAALSAAQLLPVVEFTQETVRTTTSFHDIYTYSIEPFRVVELLWPSVFGSHFGNNTYWRDAFDLPGVRPELWTPSLYLGVLTLALGCGQLAVRRAPAWRVWLSVIVLVSFFGSLGRYASPIWAARAAIRAVPSPSLSGLARSLGGLDSPAAAPIRLDGFLRDGDGGVYWWLATILPGFRYFRFPAKLFTFTALGLAALAGSGWDRLVSGGRARGRVLVLLVLNFLLSLAALAGVWIARPTIVKSFHSPTVSSTFGPIEIDGGFRAIVLGLAQASIVSSLGLLALFLVRARPFWAGALVLLVVTADLAWANARHVQTVPQALLESKPDMLRIIEDRERRAPSHVPFRVHRMASWEPPGWQKAASPHRAFELMSWHRATLYPKHGINLGVEYTHTFGVGGLAEFEPFFRDFLVAIKTPEAARMLGAVIGQRVVYHPRRSFDIWNTRYFIVPVDPHRWNEEYRGYAAFLLRSERIYPQPQASVLARVESLPKEWVDSHDVQLLRNLHELPRAWVVHDARWVALASGLPGIARDVALREILFANDPLWHDESRRTFDPRTLAWLDAANQAALTPFVSGQAPSSTEEVKVRYPTPQRAELDVSLDSPGLVILSDLFYPGWELTIDGVRAPIYRVNLLMRGAAVQGGRHELVYSYRPWSFRLGQGVSVVGLIALAIACVACAWRPADPRIEGIESAGRCSVQRAASE
jgi:hypothetical protein